MSGRIKPHRKTPGRFSIYILALAAAVLLAGCEFAAPATPTPHVQRLPMVFDDTQSEAAPAYPAPPEGTSFDVQVNLEAAADAVQVGETLVLTATTENNSVGCQYPLYEISLQESEPGNFEFLSPQVIGPPGESPARFEVRPVQAGTWELSARAYGEQDCSGGWQWQYVSSPPITITVNP